MVIENQAALPILAGEVYKYISASVASATLAYRGARMGPIEQVPCAKIAPACLSPSNRLVEQSSCSGLITGLGINAKPRTKMEEF